MKNILIITNGESGCHMAHFKDINDIVDPDLRKMVENNINGVNYSKDGYWSDGNYCGAGGGYVFGDYSIDAFPITVEHIIECCGSW